MRSSLVLFSVALLGWALLAWATGASAEPESRSDKTLAPYFRVKGGDTSLEQLPLKSTRADVNISGVIAGVKVAQVFKNNGARPIEAVYVFPASTRAAVNGLTMTIGSRTITAVIKEREAARADYTAAREAGQSASLLEEERPNVFTMSVANIMPGDEIKVELTYTELLTSTEGQYEFVYPTVVGPRYSNIPVAGAAPQDRFIASSYTHAGEAASYTFDVSLHIDAGMPIQEILSPSHKVIVANESLGSASVTLDPSDTMKGNKDFIVRYRLAGETVKPGLLLYQGKEENFFLMMVQPPRRVASTDIPPREYIFVVDVSGSMSGFPLDLSKKLMRNLLVNLRPTDRFNILLFAGASTIYSEQSMPVNAAEIERAANFLDNAQAGGGTELLAALERVAKIPHATGFSRSAIVITDGYIGMEKGSFEIIANNLNNTNVFAFGIGSSVNRYLIEGMARAGQGAPFVVTREEDASGEAERFRKYVQEPVLTGITASFDGFDVLEVTPKSVPDVFATRPIVLFGKWRGPVGGKITLRGVTGAGKFEETLDVTKFRPASRNAALMHLWARNEVARLEDYNIYRQDVEAKNAVTRLGLQYSLLTPYTSFVAVDKIVRRDTSGQLVTVEQALPLPEGCENSAVGFEFDLPGKVIRSGSTGSLSFVVKGIFLLVVVAIIMIIAAAYGLARSGR